MYFSQGASSILTPGLRSCYWNLLISKNVYSHSTKLWTKLDHRNHKLQATLKVQFQSGKWGSVAFLMGRVHSALLVTVKATLCSANGADS